MSEHTQVQKQTRHEYNESRNQLSRFIGKTAVVGAIAAVVGVGVVKHETQPPQTPIQDRAHREYVVKSPQERLWGIARQAYPDRITGDASYQIQHEQPGNFSPGSMHVGEVIYLEPDAKIGTLHQTGDSAPQG